MTKPIRLALLAALVAMTPLPAQKLAKRLDPRLDAPGLDRLLWGVAVADSQGHLLYSRNADRLFTPASNAKLLVSVTATALLGPDFTVETSLYGSGPIVNDVLDGNLVLYGRGDPTFSNHCYATDTTAAGSCDHDPFHRLRDLASQLQARGVRVIAGDLIGDGSWFEPTLVHPTWEGYDLGWWYAAPVSGLGFNDNSVDVHETAAPAEGFPPTVTLLPDLGFVTLDNRAVTGARDARRTFDLFRSDDGTGYLANGVLPLGTDDRVEYAAVMDPNRYAAIALRHELLALGITVRGTVRSTVDPVETAPARALGPLATVTSRPLRDWIYPILNSSQNWFAEMLLKQLGRQRGRGGSWSAGLAVERRFLIDSVGIDSTAFVMEDGSGLAANDLVTPHALTQLLAFARRHPTFPVIEAALPVGGRSGTLKSRFVGTPVEGKVRAKTGTISRTATVSGYVDRPDGTSLIFSVMANHNNLTGTQIQRMIDSVIVEIGTPDRKSRRH